MSQSAERVMRRQGSLFSLVCRHAAAWTGVVIVESWLSAPPLALAGLESIKSLKPILANPHGALSLNYVYATNGKKTNQGLNDTRTRVGFRESLNLSTLGYVYNPNLMLFDLSGTMGKDQSRIYEYDILRGEEGLTSKRSDSFDGYDLSALFLRQKPYTLELFTSRDKKFATSATNFSLDQEEIQESGGEFTYNKRVYNAKLKYAKTQKTKDIDSSSIDFYDLTCDIYKPSLGSLEDFMTSLSARYQDVANHIVSGDGGKENTQDNTFSNHFTYKIFDLSTNLSSLTSDFSDKPDGGISPSYHYDIFNINESIGVDLPWDFTSRILLSKNMGDDQSTTLGSGSELSRQRDASRDDERYNVTLTQTLYKSLVTTLTANKASMFSSRAEAVTQKDGTVNALAPVDGQNDVEAYGLESRYRKQLPHGSLGTAFLSTRSSDINRTGLTRDVRGPYLLAPSIVGGANFISLDRKTDITSLTVEVFKRNPQNSDNSDGCENAYQTPRAEYPQCWIELTLNTHFTVEPGSGAQPQVMVDLTSLAGTDLADLGFDYGSYGPDDPFPFRVKTFLTPEDSTTATNSAGAGLTLFEFISSEYQHSVTTQEGNYSGVSLDPKVVDDLFALGFAVKPFALRASREWVRARGDEIITELKLTFEESRKFYDKITISLGAEAHTAVSDATDSQGYPSPSSEDGYACRLDGRTPLPYINANIRAMSHYSFTRGEIIRLLLNDEGTVIRNQSFGIGDRSTFRNSIALNKPFKIPRIDFSINSYVRYLWETVDSDDDTTERNTWQYGVNALRVWNLGATTINLKANYAISEDSVDDGRYNSGLGTGTTREESSDNTSVILSIVRQLF